MKYLSNLEKDTFLRINKTKHLEVKTGNLVRGISYNSNKMLNCFDLRKFEEITENEFRENYTKVLKSIIF